MKIQWQNENTMTKWKYNDKMKIQWQNDDQMTNDNLMTKW